MTKAEELLACPFCGGEPQLVTGGPGNWYVRCLSCKCSTDDTMSEVAVTRWNTRLAAQADAQGGKVLAGYLLPKSGFDNGHYFLTPKEFEPVEERFRHLYVPVYYALSIEPQRAESGPAVAPSSETYAAFGSGDMK